MGPCIVEIDYNRCRNEDIIFQGFSAYSDGRTEDGDNHNIPTFSPKSKGIITKNLAPTNVMTKFHEDLTKTKTLRVHLRSLVRGQAIPYKFTQSCHSLIMHLLIRLQDA
ncbi:hypothetical protein DPMN_044174 [Dreissena polymorpha]|uniref:Uncharacterized protein n=1 Tax=Dreissena polymorpha TaxID=45954 RepID=A0A9D3YVS4_DREPO|nr:hypothetical protein DPMN_080803 [Dreissena polymorpha]KAH3737581.1 hypothetical protein DPMN_044174 [Dreissena polymorpha]